MTAGRAAGIAVALLIGACSHEETNSDAAAVNIDAAANEATTDTANASARPAPRTPAPPPSGIATATPLAAPTPIEPGGTATVNDSEEPVTNTQIASLPAAVSARYRCVDGSRYTVRFDNRADTATLVADGKPLGTMVGQRPASGIWYKGDGWELRGKGRQATLTKPDGPALPCIS